MVSPQGTKKKTGKRVVICVGGMAGSGKSTLARRLASKYELQYISGGDALKSLAVQEGYNFIGPGWWESPEGLRFLEEREKDHRFDEKVDSKLLQMAKKGNVILDSWTMPWLIEKGFKIWLEVSRENRAERIAGRDKLSFKDALKALKRKEEETKKIYKDLYGFSLGEDLEPFNFILDANNLKSKEVLEIVCRVIDHVVFGSHSEKA